MNLTREELQGLSRLLDEALDLPEGERSAWLDHRSGHDAHLVPMLREMLTQEAQAGTKFILPPLPEYNESILAELASGEDSGLEADAVVGPYRLLRELGRGGMGSVWLAERTDGTVKRQVALKLPHSSLPHRQLAERFARERDILAGLTHPHIARLYDAGVTEDGRPYLALEYVEGEPVNEYCDAHRLSIKSRLDLFLQVLSALQYAHGQLVVHRDLKPSNILVTAEGEVKLLDFGIAKLLTDGQARETELTLVGGRALTPQYASPEQILGQPIGTASDVYGLGVVLYELLTGSLPYRLKRDSRGALEDAILSADPTRPSQTEVLLGNAVVRSSTTRKLATTLKGDLDTIVLKSLKKNPSERYATAQLFADDIRRYLADEAVLAQPDSSWYRSRKFIRRNWLAAGATTAVLLALSVGLGIALWQARVARQEAQTAKAVQAFLLDIFQANSSNQSDPQKARQTTARELLDIGARKVDTALIDAPQAKIEILATLGQLYVELGMNAQSANLARKRVQLARKEFGGDSLQLAEALLDLGFAVNTQLIDPEWERSLKEAEDILDRRGDSESPLRARMLSRLADYYQEKDLTKAADYIDRSLEIYRKSPPDREQVSALFSAASVRLMRGEYSRARSIIQEAIAGVQGPVGKDGADFLPNLYTYLGQVEKELDGLPAADHALRQGWELSRTLNGDDNVDTVTNLAEYAHFLASTGHATADGIAKLEQAAEQIKRIHGGEDLSNQWIVLRRYVPDIAHYGRIESALDTVASLRDAMAGLGNSLRLATLTGKEADVLVNLGAYSQAGRLLDEAQAMRMASGTTDLEYERDDQQIRLRLLLIQRRHGEAAALVDKWFSDESGAASLSSKWLSQRVVRGQLALASGNVRLAHDLAQQSLARIERSPDRSYLVVFEQRLRLIAGKALQSMHQSSDAEPLLRQAVTIGSGIFDHLHSPEFADAQIALADCLIDLGNPEEARFFAAKARAIHATHRKLGEHYRQPLRALESRLDREI